MSANPRKGPSGRKVTYTAPTGGVSSGDIVILRAGTTGWCGEAIADIAATEAGAVEVGHQAEIPKLTGTGESFAVGDLWYRDSSTGSATPNATGNALGGSVAEAAAVGATTVMAIFALTGGDS